MNKKEKTRSNGRLVTLMLIIVFIISSCGGEMPNGVDFSKPDCVAAYLAKTDLGEQQKKDLLNLLQKGQAVSGTTTVDAALMQKIADLEKQIVETKEQTAGVDKKIADAQGNVSAQIANNNTLLVTDYTNKISVVGAAQATFNSRLDELYRQKLVLESKLNDQVSKLADLDTLTRSFIQQNKEETKTLFAGMNQLKANGLLRDDDVNIVKDLQLRIDGMNDLFAKIFNSTKTQSEELEENRQILEK
ncbi:MAG: hypothetical protein AAB870_02380, partial [Patescibacteria group bacterium]